MSEIDEPERKSLDKSWLTVASLTNESLESELAHEESGSAYYAALLGERHKRASWRASQGGPIDRASGSDRASTIIAVVALVIAIAALFLVEYASRMN